MFNLDIWLTNTGFHRDKALHSQGATGAQGTSSPDTELDALTGYVEAQQRRAQDTILSL